MKYPKIIAVTLSLFIIMLAFSCNKGTMLNLDTVRIATVAYSESGGGTGAARRLNYTISYDNYDNVDSIHIIGGGTDTGENDYITFNYVGSSFVINDQINGSLMVDANTNGQIIKLLLIDTISMTYNGNELTQLTYAQPSYTYTYQWNNGDIANYMINGGGGAADTNYYYYDQTRLGQAGDALRIKNFLQYGRSYITTTHLPDELYYSGGWEQEYLYTFDNQGRISELTWVTKVTGSANDTETYAYTYY